MSGDEYTRELRASRADADASNEVAQSLLADLRAERAKVARLERSIARLMCEDVAKQRELDRLCGILAAAEREVRP